MSQSHQFTTNALKAHLHPKQSVEAAKKVHLKTNRRHEGCPEDGGIEGTEGPEFLMIFLKQ